MRCVCGPLGVVAVKVVTVDIEKPLHTLFDELFVGRLEGRVVGVVVLFAVGQDPGIRVAAVFHEHDWRGRTRLP